MLCCSQCFSSFTLQKRIAAQGALAICTLCGSIGRKCISAESLAPEFATLIGYYRYGSLANLLRNIAELIRSCNYDGLKYRSAMAPGGVNYAFFAPDKFETRYERSAKITEIEVVFEQYRAGLSGLIKP